MSGYNDDINTKKKIRKDGWANLFTGLGTKADKGKRTKAVNSIIIPDMELEAIYSDDGLGARIVDLLVEDMFKQGWNFEFENEELETDKLSKTYNEILDKIHIKEKVAEAFKWARLYGGSIIILGAFDGQDLSKPLAIKGIKKFESLKVIPRPNIEFGTMEFQTDPSKPRFGEVEYYPVEFKVGNNYKIAKIHWTRVIEIHSIKVPNTGLGTIPNEYRFWGIPVLQRVRDRLADLGASFGSISGLMQELSIGKYKFGNLAEMMSMADGEKLVQNRVQAMDMMKSCFHSVYLDSEDEFIRDTLSLGGVSEVLNQFMIVISSSTGYPMTRLFGISPGGLNSTGDSDTYSYYDMVKAKQELELKPVLKRIVSIISESENLQMPEICFNALEQMTEKEQAELEEKRALTDKTEAETYEKYYQLGILEPYMIEALKFGDSLKKIKIPEDEELPPVETVIEESEEE